jgi:hypothetical protein
MSVLLREIGIDNRIGSYDGYLPDEWTSQVYDASQSTAVLYQIVVDLVLGWRTTAYSAMMPATAIKAMQAATLGYAKYVTPDASVISYSEAVLAKVSRNVPELVENRDLRARLMSELVTVADEFRTQRTAVNPEMPIESLWQEFLDQDAFRLSVWASQRVAYVALYNAYEAFLVACAKQSLGVTQLRATEKAFLDALHNSFGPDLTGPCWNHHEVQIGREARHALSHAGGRETEKLKKHKHGIKVIEGVLQIVPDDNHKLLRRLRAGVDAVVAAAAAHPKFVAPQG